MRDLLTEAREQAWRAQPPVRQAALLRVARVESVTDPGKARITLEMAVEEAKALEGRTRAAVLDLARTIAAAIAPEMVDSIPAAQIFPGDHAQGTLVKVMLDHGRVDDACDWLLRAQEPSARTFLFAGNVLAQLADAGRKLALVRRTVELWRKTWDEHLLRVFFGYLPSLPQAEAQAIVREAVEAIRSVPDRTAQMSLDEGRIELTSHLETQLFGMIPVIRQLDAELAQRLLDEHPALATAIGRYPEAYATLHAEAQERIRQMKPEDRKPGYIMAGDPRDQGYQRALIDASRNGDFEPAFGFALDKYAKDAGGDEQNAAPKPFWPSAAAFRTVVFQAGKQMGDAAVRYLSRIPDDDLRLLAKIELAASLAGLPDLPGMQMTSPTPENRMRRRQMGRTPEENEPILSPTGQAIRCPKCKAVPTKGDRWGCKCRYIWNTFETRGLCPGCGYQWEITACLNCGQVSGHSDWYEPG